ncbi:MAG TPA: hypothetical protein VGO07_00440 [Candidatus Saccharimonadales bacterium]|jgi:hypothetical protein|nr:hypothetical protein [Candidatus Saccharimonadales bacterium]
MRYFLGFLAVVALIVAVFILVLKGFSGPAKPKNAITLSDYATSQTVVSVTVDGPVNADQKHEAYRITIGRDANVIEVMHGYKYEVVNAQTYASNSEAYTNFLKSIQLLGFTKGDPDPKKADPRGYCPLGDRIIYRIETGNEDVQKYWTTTCNGGTFKGNSATIRSLFIKQIPDFPKITTGMLL